MSEEEAAPRRCCSQTRLATPAIPYFAALEPGFRLAGVCPDVAIKAGGGCRRGCSQSLPHRTAENATDVMEGERVDPNGLGGLIRRRREELRLTQEELARRIGSTRAYVSQIEGGTRKWSRRYVPALADALSLSEQEMEDAAGRIRPLGGAPRGAGSTRLTRDNSKLRLRVSKGPTDTQVALGYIDGLMEALGDRLDDRGRAAVRTLLEALADPVALRGLEAEADAEKAEAVAIELQDDLIDHIASTAQSLASSLDKLVTGWWEPGSTEGARLLRQLFRNYVEAKGGVEGPGR